MSTQSDLYVGEYPIDMTPEEAAEEIARKHAEWTKAIVEAERRSLVCLTAMAGIENPAAFVEAARGMMEALERIEKTMDGYRSQAKFCDIEALGYFREFDRRVEAAEFRTALTAFRAQIGEA